MRCLYASLILMSPGRFFNENRPANGQNAACILIMQLPVSLLNQSLIPVLESEDLGIMLQNEAFRHGTYDGIEPGAIAAAGQNTNSRG